MAEDSASVKAELEAKYLAMGYDPADAQKMAEAAMLSREQEYYQSGLDAMSQGPAGTHIGGQYGTFVQDPVANLMRGYRGGQAMREMPGVFERGQEAARASADTMARAFGQEAGSNPTVDALRAPGPGRVDQAGGEHPFGDTTEDPMAPPPVASPPVAPPPPQAQAPRPGPPPGATPPPPMGGTPAPQGTAPPPPGPPGPPPTPPGAPGAPPAPPAPGMDPMGAQAQGLQPHPSFRANPMNQGRMGPGGGGGGWGGGPETEQMRKERELLEMLAEEYGAML